MKRTNLTKKSTITLFLLTAIFTSVYAQPVIYRVKTIRQQQNSSLKHDIESVLIKKGLDLSVAKKRVKELLKDDYTLTKLDNLYNNKVLQLNKVKIDEKLAELALFNKNIELDSYSSLYTLVQDTKVKPLNKIQKDELKSIVEM